MAQFYSLEEAARVLGISPDELKAKAQAREIRAFMDSGSWRFRVADVEEEARKKGMGSDPDLSLSDLDLISTGDGDSFDLSEFSLGVAGSDLAPKSYVDVPAVGSSSDADILIDEARLPSSPSSSSSSTILAMDSSSKLPSDSDVRLVPDELRDASDSDVTVSPVFRHSPSDSDVTLVSDDVSGLFDSGSGDFGVVKTPSGEFAGVSPPSSSGELLVGSFEETSDFELTPSGISGALQPESGSDFELSAMDFSEEMESLTPTPTKRSPGDSDVTGAGLAAAGINMAKPSDSGINLTSFGGLDLDSHESIELAPLSGDELPQQKKPAPAPAPAPAAKKKPSPAETPVPAARKEKDIFSGSDTDFELDLTASGNEDQTMQLEAQSDFELSADSEPSSEVFALEEEEVDESAATAMRPSALDEEEDEFGLGGAEPAPVAAKGKGKAKKAAGSVSSAWGLDEESEVPATSGPARVLSSAGAQAEWGGLWVMFLGVGMLLVMLLSFVSMDLVRNMYEWRSSTAASGLIQTLAGLIGG